jgi:hypothetical protein
MNDENLKGNGFNEITAKRQREIASMGGKKSAEVRRQRRDIKRAAEAILEEIYTMKDKNTGEKKELSGAEAIILKQFEKALKGDSKAFELIRDSSGQKPVDKVMVAEVEQSVIDEVEAAVMAQDVGAEEE